MTYEETIAIIILSGYTGNKIYRVFGFLYSMSDEDAKFVVATLIKAAKLRQQAKEGI